MIKQRVIFQRKLLVYGRVDGEKDPKKDHQRPFLRPVEDLWGVKRCEKPLAASMPVRTANPFPPGTCDLVTSVLPLMSETSAETMARCHPSIISTLGKL